MLLTNRTTNDSLIMSLGIGAATYCGKVADESRKEAGAKLQQILSELDEMDGCVRTEEDLLRGQSESHELPADLAASNSDSHPGTQKG